MEKGIILAGEAAQAYITFKYVELVWATMIVIGIGLLAWWGLKKLIESEKGR